jgi:hypothetical protein
LHSSIDENVQYDAYLKMNLTSLETEVLKRLKEQKVRIPSDIHKVISKDGEPIAEADFYYNPKICVFIDGPDHDKEHVNLDDEKKRTRLRKLGYKILVILHSDIRKGLDELISSLK